MDHVIDATDKKPGRLASEIAVILQGKTKASYLRRLPGGERVIVKNITKLDISHRKFESKVTYRHTGPLGHLKERKFLAQFEKDPGRTFRQVVAHMLPKNRLQAVRMRQLVIER